MEKKKFIWILAVVIVLSVAAGISEHIDAVSVAQDGVEREAVGGADRTETFWYQIDGSKKKALTFDVSAQILTEDEAMQLLEEARTEWENNYLSKNASAEKVASDLYFPSALSDGLVTVNTVSDQPTMVDETGKLFGENIPEEGEVISLETVFSYENYELTDVRSIHVYPPAVSDEQMLEATVQDAVLHAEEGSRETKKLVLPETVDGHSVKWEKQKSGYWAVILLLGAAFLAALYFREKEEAKKRQKDQEEQLVYEYPQMVEQICLLLGSGMTIRRAWERMTAAYRRQKELYQIQDKLFMEEMLITEYEMKTGRGERECYERFGIRTGAEPYRRFAAILTRNLSKGNDDIRRLLEEEADQAMLMRKNTALRLGEEASTKLLGPMLIMFLVILAAVIFPALENF